MDHLQTVPTVAATCVRITVFLNRFKEVVHHPLLEQKPSAWLIPHVTFLINVFLRKIHTLPGLNRCLLLAFVNKHCGADTLPYGDSAFGPDQIDSVSMVVRFRLGKEFDIAVDPILESERRDPTLTEDESCVPILWVDLSGELDIVNRGFPTVKLSQVGVTPFDISCEKADPVVEVGAHFHKRIPCFSAALIESPEPNELPDFTCGNPVQNLLVVRACPLDVVYCEFYAIVVANLNHFVGLRQREGNRLLAKDVNSSPGCGKCRGMM